ncbi:MAG: hypothetical protein P8Z80_06400 [Pseudolabrys sp.]
MAPFHNTIRRQRLYSERIADRERHRRVLRDSDRIRAMTDGVLSFLHDEPREAGIRIDPPVRYKRSMADSAFSVSPYATKGPTVSSSRRAHVTLPAAATVR